MARRSTVCPPMMIARAKKSAKRFGVGITAPHPGRQATPHCARILKEARKHSTKCYMRILRICLGAMT